MSFIDKIMNAMHLNTDDDIDEDGYLFDDEEEEVVEEKKPRKFAKETYEVKENPRESEPVVKTKPNISSFRKSKTVPTGMEVVVVRPTSVEDAREITEKLLNGRTVLLNMEGLNLEIAQRIIDFTSGSCFAIAGNLQKVSNYIFIITPSSVEISGDLQDLFDSFDITGVN